MQLDDTSVEAVSETVANITGNTAEVDSAAVSVAGNIVADLTDDAIDNEEVHKLGQ